MMPPRQTVHLSFEPGPHRMAMGLVARDPGEMIELDEHYVAEMALRRDLLATKHAEVYGATPGSEAARAETLARIAALLPARFPHWFSRDGDILHNHLTGEAWDVANPRLDPLELAGRLVQEDLCLLDLTAGGPVLSAAVLCFPTRWRLHEKLGHPLAIVHERVPFYGEKLARPVDRLMQQLRAGKLVERRNWSVIDSPALFQPTGKWRADAGRDVTAENAGETMFLRVERQTLSNQPRSGSVLFTIRVHSYPLARIAAQPAVAADLAAAIRALPPEVQHYKSVAPYRAAVLAYLDRRAGAADMMVAADGFEPPTKGL